MALAPSRSQVYRRDRPVLWQHIDVGVITMVLGITAIGVLMVFSATRGPATELEPANTSFLVRQIVFAVLGFALMGAVAAFDYRKLRALSPVLYGGLLAALAPLTFLAVSGAAENLFFAPEVNGIRAWYRLAGAQLQPAEFGKVVVIVALAAFLSSTADIDMRRLLLGLALVAVPVGFIYLQPDLGTILVFIAITGGMVVVSGVRPRHLVVVLVLLGLLVGAGLASNQLKAYQLARFTAFLDESPEDQLAIGARENVEQAQIAIGNGGLTGTGLFQGTQTRSELVPEQQTDFIFSVVAEELGFIGSASLLLLFGLLLLRIWRIAHLAADTFGLLICAGVFSMLLFHIFQSVGMTLGIMPVTGIPLPFVSYGGSSMLTMFAGLGLVLSVHMHRFS